MRLRRFGPGHLSAHPRSSGWPKILAGPRRLAAVAAVAAALVLTLVGVAAAGVFTGPGAGPQAAGHQPSASQPRQAGQDGGGSAASPAATPGHKAPGQKAKGRPGGPPKAAAPVRSGTSAAARTRVLRTSCRSVAHIGDSTSVGLISPYVIPDPAQRLAARYADVGVRHLWVDASGGRSIVEEMPGQVNGYGVANAWRSSGYRGCWVIALGTNDTANVSVGSAVGLMARIDRMMSVANGEPVMWVNTRTLLSSGPWSESDMQTWNSTLLQACARYPNMRVLDWASVANPGWFLTDGIHYTSAGFAARAQAIANGLARAFPRDGHSHGCVVR